MKLAYADVYRYNADPRRELVPVKQLLSKEYARSRAALINPNRANPAAGYGQAAASDTVYFTVADGEGNIASWIQSIFGTFGSALVVPGCGFVLQNRGAGFRLDPAHPNVLAGGKRPFHTIIPGFLQRGGLNVGFGIMGGANQPLAHAQLVSNVVDCGMNWQQALEAPRFFKGEAEGVNVAIEGRVGADQAGVDELDGLRRRGHVLDVLAPYSQQMGRGQVIALDSATNVRLAASDPRADGVALPEA
jgi:gamma-glutamyltranspeptidase / glutathione hydrolase